MRLRSETSVSAGRRKPKEFVLISIFKPGISEAAAHLTSQRNMPMATYEDSYIHISIHSFRRKNAGHKLRHP
jgi:hypothetical protein